METADSVLDSLLAETPAMLANPSAPSFTLRRVMGELKAGGGFTAIQLIMLIPQIIDLIETFGPQVAEIVRQIREMFGK